MNFNEYQVEAYKLAAYENIGHNVIYPALGLAGEAGEAVDKIKKLWRNKGLTDGNKYSQEDRIEIAKELGDLGWYLSAITTEIGYTLQEVFKMNLTKLQDRQARNVIKSEGDNR